MTRPLFTITTEGRDQREVQGRTAAIEAAKRMSRRTWRPVEVQREDEQVNLRYRRGALQEYRLETRRRSSRSHSNGRS
jgi:hypothetical protein